MGKELSAFGTRPMILIQHEFKNRNVMCNVQKCAVPLNPKHSSSFEGISSGPDRSVCVFNILNFIFVIDQV